MRRSNFTLANGMFLWSWKTLMNASALVPVCSVIAVYSQWPLERYKAGILQRLVIILVLVVTPTALGRPHCAASSINDFPETETSSLTHLDVDVDVDDDERLVDLTTKVVKELTYAIAQGSFGDVWKCRFSAKDNNVEVAVKCVRIEIQDDRFKDIVNKRLMDDFHKWKPLRHDNILPLCGITYGFGPVPAIVSPWMSNGSLSTYLDKNYDSLSEAHKFGLLADVAAGLQYLHSNEVAHADLTGSNVLINSDGRALVADYGLLTTCSDLNGTSYIRSNVRWAAPELFEVPDTEDAPSSPKLESDIYSFGCIAYQVLSGQQPYCNIRSDHQVVVAILRGVKPKRPDIPAIEDCHWNFIEQCWVELSQRPPIADVRDLMYHYRDAMC